MKIDTPPARQSPIFSFDAYSPAEIEATIETVGVAKANLPFVPCFTLGVIAGAGIGLGALAWLLKATGRVPAGIDASLITAPGVAYNLVWVTLGNIVGGAGFVGLTYWTIYHQGLGLPPAAK